ncbi:MAG: MOSC domain-containing protein [Hyphomicrobiaceae bacterium]
MSDGRLIAIARRPVRLAPMQEIPVGLISAEAGLVGDCKRAKPRRRQITVLAREAWQTAAAQVGEPDLPWTVRRANLLIAGIELPRGKGSVFRIGEVRLELTGQTYPCGRMEEAHPGLLRALARDWRGGFTCRVLEGGRIVLGEPVEVLAALPEVLPRLPG